MGVIIRSPDGRGYGSKIIDEKTGAEVGGITEVDVSIRFDEYNRATLQIFTASIEVKALPVFIAADPSTGETKEVARIEFADGTVWTPEG